MVTLNLNEINLEPLSSVECQEVNGGSTNPVQAGMAAGQVVGYYVGKVLSGVGILALLFL